MDTNLSLIYLWSLGLFAGALLLAALILRYANGNKFGAVLSGLIAGVGGGVALFYYTDSVWHAWMQMNNRLAGGIWLVWFLSALIGGAVAAIVVGHVAWPRKVSAPAKPETKTDKAKPNTVSDKPEETPDREATGS